MVTKVSTVIHPSLAAAIASIHKGPKYLLTATDDTGKKVYFKANSKGLEYTSDRTSAMLFVEEHAEMYATELQRIAEHKRIKQYTFSYELS